MNDRSRKLMSTELEELSNRLREAGFMNISIPTTSRLIDEIGENLYSLHRSPIGFRADGWR